MKNNIMFTWDIIECDRYLFEWFSHQKVGSQIGKVHSVFNRVINFITMDKKLLFSIARNDVIQAPRMMKVGETADFQSLCSFIKPSMPIEFIGNNRIQINHQIFDFSKAKEWQGYIIPKKGSSYLIEKESLEKINSFIHLYGTKEGIYPSWKKHYEPTWEVPKDIKGNIYFTALLSQLSHLNQEIERNKLESSLQGFVGLGIGLTPSGDDFLTGLMATWQFYEFPLFETYVNNNLFTERHFRHKTTDISYFMLTHCLNGEVNEALFLLLKNIDGHVEPYVEKLLSIGSTSGTDMLIGISCAYQYVLNMKEET